MAWTFRGEFLAGASSGASITSDDDGGAQAGDLIVVDAWSDATGDSIQATQGTGAAWNRVQEATGAGHDHVLFWKIANATEPTTFNFTRTGVGQGFGAIGRAYNPGGDTITVDDTSQTIDNLGGQTCETTSITAVAGVDSVALIHVAFSNDSSTTIDTDPSGVSPAGGNLLNSTSTPDVGLTAGASYYNLTQSAGAFTKTITWTGTDSKIGMALTAHLTAGAGARPPAIYELAVG